MAKAKTLTKRKKSSPGLTKHDPTKSLKDPKAVLETLLHCLVENDLESFEDVLIAYLMVASKTALAKETKLGRTTLYDLMSGGKAFNPTLSTLGPIFQSLAKKAA